MVIHGFKFTWTLELFTPISYPYKERLDDIIKLNQARLAATNGRAKHRTLSLFRILSYLYLISLCSRFLAYSWLQNPTYDPNLYLKFIEFNPIIETILSGYNYNRFIGYFFALFWLLVIYTDYLCYIKLNSQLWAWLRQIWTENDYIFMDLNPEFAILDFKWSKPFDRVNGWPGLINWMIRCWHCQSAWFYSQLSHLPNLTTNVRTKTVAVKLFLERAELWWQNIVGKRG